MTDLSDPNECAKILDALQMLSSRMSETATKPTQVTSFSSIAILLHLCCRDHLEMVGSIASLSNKLRRSRQTLNKTRRALVDQGFVQADQFRLTDRGRDLFRDQ